jgi:hypothetical protein
MKFINNSFNTDLILPRVLIATVTFYFLKTAFWPLTYLFVAGLGISAILLVINFDHDFKLADFINDFKLPILLAGVFILEFIVRGQFLITIVQKEIFLLFLLFSFFYILYWRRSLFSGNIISSYFIKLLIITIIMISILNLLIQFFHLIFSADLLSQLNISNGLTIANDYNYFSLFLLFGLVIINYNGESKKFYYHISGLQTIFFSLILIINILLSGSRRAFLVLILLSAIKIIGYVFSKKKDLNSQVLLKRFLQIILFGFIFFLFLVLVARYIPKTNLKAIATRYSTFTETDNLRRTEKYLWKGEPEIPSDFNHLIDKASLKEDGKYWKCVSAPGTSIQYLNTIYGKSIQVTRNGSRHDGYSLQFVGPDILYYANHTYKISFKIKLLSGDFNSFKVGWWVNDNNRGFANCADLKKETEPIGDGWYNCISEYTFIDNHFGLTGFFNSVLDRTSFVISDFELIDLNKDLFLPRYVFEVEGNDNLNTWLDKHNAPYIGNNLVSNGNFKYNGTFWKRSSDSSINIKIVDFKNVRCALISRGIGNGGDWSLFYAGRSIVYQANNEYQISFKIMPVKPYSIPFKVGFWVDEGEGFKNDLKLKIKSLNERWLEVKASYLFKHIHSDLRFFINSQLSNSQFYITDISLTNLTHLQNQIDTDICKITPTNKESLFSERITRWIYARDLGKLNLLAKTNYSVMDLTIWNGMEKNSWVTQRIMIGHIIHSYRYCYILELLV